MGQSLTEINFATVIVQKDEILPIWHVFTCPCCKWTCLTQFYCKKKNCYLIKTHWLITFKTVTLSALPLWSNDYKARKGLPPLAWSRPVWWLFVKEVKASAKRFWFLFLFSHFSKSLPLIFTRSRSFVFLGKHFIDPKNIRLACLYSRGQLATFFLQITPSLLACQNSLWLKKRSCVSKVLISLMVYWTFPSSPTMREFTQKHAHQYRNLK